MYDKLDAVAVRRVAHARDIAWIDARLLNGRANRKGCRKPNGFAVAFDPRRSGVAQRHFVPLRRDLATLKVKDRGL